MAQHLIGWILVGLVVGCIYGWRRQAPTYNRRLEALNAPIIDRKTRAHAIGQQRGYRLIAVTFGAAFGTFGGLIVGVLTWIIAGLFELR
jgi:hypothetical protein